MGMVSLFQGLGNIGIRLSALLRMVYIDEYSRYIANTSYHGLGLVRVRLGPLIKIALQEGREQIMRCRLTTLKVVPKC